MSRWMLGRNSYDQSIPTNSDAKKKKKKKILPPVRTDPCGNLRGADKCVSAFSLQTVGIKQATAVRGLTHAF